VEFHTEGSSEAAEEMGDEFRAVVQGNMSQYSMLGEDMEDEEASQSDCGEGIVCWDEDSLLGELVYDDKNGSVSS